MTRRERLSRCFACLETDRPAVFSRPGFPQDDPTYDRLKAYLAEHAEQKRGWQGVRSEPSESIEAWIEPYSADFDRRRQLLHTPKGDLRSSSLVSRRGLPGMQETYWIQSTDDIERYLSLPLPAFQVDAASFAAAESEVGDRGIVDISLGHNPGGFSVALCGSETFAVMSVTDRDELHRLCERRQAILLRLIEALLAAGAGPFFSLAGQEYIVPPLHGPVDFEDFNARYDRPLIERIHQAGGWVHVHCHGSMKRVLQGFVDMGVDVLHPFEPPPQGDILAAEAKAMARGRMCLEGNIQINRMYEASPDEIRAETRQLIADAFDDRRGLIVTPTASPYIRGQGERCFPQYQAMVETVLASGSDRS